MEDIKEVIEKLENKGKPILKGGGTGSGKSTFGISIAKDSFTVSVLTKRQGKGKGTLTSTHEIITDYYGIPDGHVFVSGSIRKADGNDKDDNELICSVLYDFIKDYIKNPSIDVNETLNKHFKSKLNSESNETLSFKLKNLKNVEIIATVFNDSNFISNLKTIYAEANNDDIAIKQNKDKYDIFMEHFNRKIESNHPLLKKFWDEIIYKINEYINEFIKEIQSLNTDSSYDSTTNKFYVDIDDSVKDTEVVNKLLNSERSFIENFISDMTIYYKADDEVFDNISNKFYEAIKENDTIYHVIHFIDTMGLFHKTNKVRIEKQRIFSLLSTFHSSNFVLFLTSDLGAIDKSSKDCISDFIRECNKNINVYIVFTKYDILLNSKANSSDGNPFLCKSTRLIDNKQAISDANNEIFKLYNDFVSASSAGSKISIQHFVAGYPVNEEMSEVLNSLCYNYRDACINVLKNIGIRSDYKPYEVTKSNISIRSIQMITDNKPYDFSEIFKDICKCIGLCEGNIKPHWTTVKAVIRHWSEDGESNTSNAGGEKTGFACLEALFVNYIKNSLSNPDFYNNLEFTDDVFRTVDPQYKESCVNELSQYIRFYLKKEFVKTLFRRVYAKYESIYKDQYLYYYNELREILKITQTEYYDYTNISFNDKLKECFIESVQYCINSFIKERCIEVY